MRLTIDKIGEFYEVFDWDTKTTLFVSASKKKCINEAKLITLYGLSGWLSSVKQESD